MGLLMRTCQYIFILLTLEEAINHLVLGLEKNKNKHLSKYKQNYYENTLTYNC